MKKKQKWPRQAEVETSARESAERVFWRYWKKRPAEKTPKRRSKAKKRR